MKKNKALTAALSVFALTMMSMCAIGGTFAKYVTTKSGEDSARVAKWGVAVTVNGDETAILEETGDSKELEVVSNTGEIMAPGTKGEFLNISVSGTPEVAVRITYDATVTFSGDWTNGTSYYCPLQVFVNGTEVSKDTVTSTTTFADAIEKAIESYSRTYKAGTDLSSKSNEELKVTWKWVIGAASADDTYLGDKAADGDASNDPKITVEVKTTVTQED